MKKLVFVTVLAVLLSSCKKEHCEPMAEFVKNLYLTGTDPLERGEVAIIIRYDAFEGGTSVYLENVAGGKKLLIQKRIFVQENGSINIQEGLVIQKESNLYTCTYGGISYVGFETTPYPGVLNVFERLQNYYGEIKLSDGSTPDDPHAVWISNGRLKMQTLLGALLGLQNVEALTTTIVEDLNLEVNIISQVGSVDPAFRGGPRAVFYKLIWNNEQKWQIHHVYFSGGNFIKYNEAVLIEGFSSVKQNPNLCILLGGFCIRFFCFFQFFPPLLFSTSSDPSSLSTLIPLTATTSS